MKYVFIAAILFCANICAGETTAVAKAEPSKADIIVQKAVGKLVTIKSLRVKSAMRIVDEPAKFTLGVNTNTVAEAPANVRIQASKLAGRIKAFDIGIYGENIQFYMPRGKVMYKGTAESLRRNTDVSFYPDEIIGHLMSGNGALLKFKWKLAAKQPGNGFAVIEEVRDPRFAWRRLTIDTRRDRFWLMLVEYIDIDGTPIFNKVYKNYKALSEKHIKGGTGKFFPFWFKIDWPLEKRYVAIDFKRIEFNPELKKEDFDVHLYNPETVVIKHLKDIAEDDFSESLNESTEAKKE